MVVNKLYLENDARSFRVRKVNVVDLQQSSRNLFFFAWVEMQFNLFRRLWRVEYRQLFQQFDFRLNLRRSVGVVPEAIDKDLDMIAILLLCLKVAQLLLETLAFRLFESVIITLFSRTLETLCIKKRSVI